jgi:UTP--glucose-1-phosphate uridylyltransferase
MKKVRKAIVPMAGLATRFLPLSKTFSKEFFPLVDLPILQYILEEAKESGIKEVIFINRPEKKETLNYFKEDKKLKSFLKKRKKYDILKELKSLENLSKKITIHQVFQEKPLGVANAILQAKKFVKSEPCAILFSDDLVYSKTPCAKQLINVFNKYQKPVIAFSKVSKNDFKHYGMADFEKISARLLKIKNIIEKPSNIKETPSDLAVVGKYIITPEVFNIFEKNTFSIEKEISLTEILAEMARKGEEIYGWQIEGKWLECGNKLAYLKSNFYLSLKHPQFGQKLRDYLKEII